ncbi:hypothetical protein Tco_0007453 [Tanacetum coccineum]
MASIHFTFLNGDLDEEVYMNQPQGFIMPGNENKVGSDKGIFVIKILKKFNYFDCTLVSTPMDTREKLMPNNGQAVSQLEYSRVIGCLMYAMTCTRPDIAFSIGKLSRYTSNLGTQHWQAIHQVSKYFKKTMNYRLTYTSYPSVLEDHTDASWINNTKDNSSTSGWVFLLGGGVISWASKKQTYITGSTMEYEFMALVAADKEAKFSMASHASSLLDSLRFPSTAKSRRRHKGTQTLSLEHPDAVARNRDTVSTHDNAFESNNDKGTVTDELASSILDNDSEEVKEVFLEKELSIDPMDRVFDDARKKKLAFSPKLKVRYFDREDIEEVEHENAYSIKS